MLDRMADHGTEVWKGSVAAWECDVMGHFTIEFYNAKVIEGLAALMAEMGMPGAFGPAADATVIVRDEHIRFLREAPPGAPLTLTGGVLRLGDSDALLSFFLWHASGAIAATFQVEVAHILAGSTASVPWPQHVRLRAGALAVEVPPELGPRSLAMNPVQSAANMTHADALGLPCCARTAVMAGDCDAFGRVRPERMIGLIANGMPHLVNGVRPLTHEGRRVGGAVLEYRLVYLKWPRTGDLIMLRSGYVEGDARLRRMVHWLLDPIGGQPWCVAEAIGVTLDLETRKIIEMSAASLTAADAGWVPGLTL